MENKWQRSTYFPRENYDHLRTQSKGSRDSGVNGWPRCGWEDIASLYVEARRSRDGDPYDWIQRYVPYVGILVCSYEYILDLPVPCTYLLSGTYLLLLTYLLVCADARASLGLLVIFLATIAR